MAKTEQIVNLEPSTELKFKGPFNDVVTSTLKLGNPTNKRICFKIKTTAPRRYCVRPNSGIVEANSSVNVAVMLQPFEYDPHEKNKHKFMVQTIFAPDGDLNLETLFKEAHPSELMDSKLRCVFDMPADTQATQNNIDATVTSQTQGQVPPKSPKSSDTDTQLQKAGQEIKKLREESSILHAENLQLKEENLRLRNQASAAATAATDRKTALPATIMNSSADGQALNSNTQYILAFAMVILGIILGKLIL